jgi:hypothetical protein
MKKIVYLIPATLIFILFTHDAGLANFSARRNIPTEFLREARLPESGAVFNGGQVDKGWEITFGKSWGRYHENTVRQTVSSDGQKTFLNKKDGTPVVGKISETDLSEITGLVNRLKLSRARKIPSGEFNRCIVSMHLPNTYFSLTINNKEYGLSHCNKTGNQKLKYEYTLDLSPFQKTMYKRLREKLESLFAAETKTI